MTRYRIVLRILGLLIFAVGALHLFLGLRADALLGADVSPATLAEPTLESQNRFFGVSFTLYGGILFLVASDFERYAPVLRLMLAIFFAGGVARLIAWAQHGAPSPQTIALIAMELLAPPLLHVWSLRLARG